MSQNILRAAVVYMSPAGTTRRVAQVLAQALQESQWSVEVFDLGCHEHQDYFSLVERALEAGGCLFVGSPVYTSRALPPVVQFLAKLPVIQGRCGIPFVTWGGVTSGVALLEMARLLEEKGYAFVGAAKILAVHSSMLHCEHPLGEGHPDSGDEAMIRELVRVLTSRLQGSHSLLVSQQALHYLSPDVELKAWNTSLGSAKTAFDSKVVDTELCKQCGLCQEECPVQAIEVVPFLQFGDACIRCYNCMRICPEGVIKVDLSGSEERIRKRAQEYSERPLSQIFV